MTFLPCLNRLFFLCTRCANFKKKKRASERRIEKTEQNSRLEMDFDKQIMLNLNRKKNFFFCSLLRRRVVTQKLFLKLVSTDILLTMVVSSRGAGKPASPKDKYQKQRLTAFHFLKLLQHSRESLINYCEWPLEDAFKSSKHNSTRRRELSVMFDAHTCLSRQNNECLILR